MIKFYQCAGCDCVIQGNNLFYHKRKRRHRDGKCTYHFLTEYPPVINGVYRWGIKVIVNRWPGFMTQEMREYLVAAQQGIVVRLIPTFVGYKTEKELS